MKKTTYKGYKFKFGKKFKKEYYKIAKKHDWKNIDEDFLRLQITLIDDLKFENQFKKSTCIRIAGLDKKVTEPAFIIKKIRCKNLKQGSRSGFRITFIYYPKQQLIEFVEFFEKSEKETPDKNRINQLFN